MEKEEIFDNLRNMGFKSTDTIIVHTSLKSIGRIDGNLFLDSLIEYFKDGLLVIPTHTWANVNKNNPIYDPVNTESCIGVLPNLAIKHPLGVRSLHPTHSVVAFGKDKFDFVSGEEYAVTPCSSGGVYDKLRIRGGKVLLIGVGLERNTFIHCVEELLCIPNRINNVPMELQIKDGNKIIPSYMRNHYNEKAPHISLHFVKLNKALYMTNAMQDGLLGNAKCLVCDCEKLFFVIRHILSKKPECIIEDDIIDDNLWLDLLEV